MSYTLGQRVQPSAHGIEMLGRHHGKQHATVTWISAISSEYIGVRRDGIKASGHEMYHASFWEPGRADPKEEK